MEVLIDDSNGYGNGDGDGNGDGNGNGNGDGYGYGYGNGDGDGCGYGDGYGNGDGYGYGDGCGYGDGYGKLSIQYNGVSFHKIQFASAFVEKCLTGKEIVAIENAEQKATLIAEYGYAHVINDLNPKILDRFETKSAITGKPCTYELFEYKLGNNLIHRVVSVECHSTHKKTFLGVPREKATETCMGAIAWTFGETEEDYKPKIET